jgi:polysaccharide biosynthesis protein PslH
LTPVAHALLRAASALKPTLVRLKQLYFRLRRKDPEAVVVTFASGAPELVAQMYAEIQQLVPDRRHFLVDETTTQQLTNYRIGLAPVLFSNEPQYRRLRRTAFLLAPTKILAYNARLERHHLRLRSWIASLLFLRGVPLDRIFLRPTWLFPWKKDRSIYPTEYLDLQGRPFTATRKRIAVIAPYFPYPLSHGGAVRIFHLIREMAREFDVVLFAFHDRETDDDFAPVLELCARVILVKKTRYREPRWATLLPPEVREFQSPTMRRLLDQIRRELGFDVVQVEYTTLAPYGGDILVAHDVTFQLYRQIYEREHSLRTWWDYWRWRRFEQRWSRRYRSVVVMCGADSLAVCPNTGIGQATQTPGRPADGKTRPSAPRFAAKPACATVIPNGVDLARFIPEIERPGARLLFIGSFRHFPNIVAYRFFIEQIWPEVKRRSNEIRATVVAGPDPLLYWREHTGIKDIPADERIEMHGFVRDVHPLYVEANLVIVPTLVSAGTNLKVLEALAMERAVVSTSSGCAGLGLQHGVNVWIADSPHEFADALLRLLADTDLRQKIAAAGRLHAERYYDWRQIGYRQRWLIRTLIAGKIEIRAAQPADLDHIWAIQATSPEASQWHREDYLAFDCQIALIDGRLAGFLVSRQIAYREREILNVAVDPEFRRLGIAKELIRSEIARYPGDHFLEVRQSNSAARMLYKKLAFAEVGVRSGYYENPPEPGIVMRFYS